MHFFKKGGKKDKRKDTDPATTEQVYNKNLIEMEIKFMQKKLNENEFLILDLRLDYQNLSDFKKHHIDDDFLAFLQVPLQKDYLITFHYQAFTIRTYDCEFFTLDLDEENEKILFYTSVFKYGHYLDAITESEFSMGKFENLVVKVIRRKDSADVKIDFHFNLSD